MNLQEIISFIKNSTSFAEVRNAEVLPEPDQDDGFYFISYSHKDYKAVLTDIVKYSGEGLKIWYDRFLESGKSWATEVLKKIASYYCKGVVLYVTENFLQSDSCLAEADCVLKNGKSCVFVLDGVVFERFAAVINEKLGEKVVKKKGKIEFLEYSVPTDDKVKTIISLEKPELFEYMYNESTRVLKIFRSGRYAVVSKINCNDMRNVELPAYVRRNGKRYRVAGLMYSVFMNNDMLEEVTIPNGWSMLMAGAFTGCKSLHTVNLGKPKLAGMLKVGILANVFVNCHNLARINRSGGTIMLLGAFKNSKGIKEFDSDGYILGEGSFSGCICLENLKLSPKTRIIRKKVFENCKALRSVTIPKKVKSIDVTAFKGCENLKEVFIDTKCKKLYRGENAVCLDEIFCYAEKIYVKKAPGDGAFKGEFKSVSSDKPGYALFVRA